MTACRARVDLAAGRSLPCRAPATLSVYFAGLELAVCQRHALVFAADATAATRWHWPTPIETTSDEQLEL